MWEKVKLGDICDIKSGGTPSRTILEFYNGNIPWAKISDIETAVGNDFIEKTEEYITDLGLQSINNKVFEKGTLLLAIYGSVGKTAITGVQMSCNQAILGIRVKDETSLDLKYLNYWFKTITDKLKYQAVGGTLKNLSLGKVQSLKIPLPPLAIQQQIVAILDKADRLRQLDKAIEEKYDALAQSIFIDMFGDPVKNEKGWEVKKLEELGRLDRGVSKHRPRNAPELLGGKYPLIQTGDVANSKGYINSYKSTYSELGLKQSKLWNKGTLCITIAANIAKTGILELSACFPDSIVGFNANEFTVEDFVRFWFSFFQGILENQAPESAQKNINLKILRELKVIAPPIELQNEFVQKIALINQMKEQEMKGEELFQALLQKAFKGELVS